MADRNWYSNTRTGKRVANNLGVIWGQDVSKIKKYRRMDLHELENYYESKQYDALISWDEAAHKMCEGEDFIGVRKRKPRLNVPFAKMMTSRLASKLVGDATFPTFEVENDPESTEFIKAILDWSKLPLLILEPTRRMLNTGSEFLRFYWVSGQIKMQRYSSKYCYPEFNEMGQLTFVKVQYVWCDYADLDQKGKPKEKWYRIDLGQSADTLYDTPEYSAQNEPDFQVVETVTHDFGFVQGTWMRPTENPHSPDGDGITHDLTDFIDEMNYSLSQSSQAISYNQEPILTLSGMDMADEDNIVKTSSKALNLGRDGKAEYLETAMTGVETAMEMRDKVKILAQDAARVTMLDPEKIVGSAQSGKAMEVLHGPMVEHVLELRPVMESILKELVVKMMLSVMILNDRGEEIGLELPEGFVPSFEFEIKWPEVFPMTTEDLQKKVGLVVSASSASIISRDTGMRWLAKDFGIEDVEAELAKIAGQPVLNTWGGF